MTRLLALLLFVLCGWSAVHAQTGNASLTGRVTDQSKGVVASARVTVTNVGTNERRSTVTSNDGNYSVNSLPPGNYKVEIERAGFENIVKPNLVLHTEDAIEINFELQVGSSSQTITVTDSAGQIDTSPAVGLLVNRDFVENIPLNGRSFQDLLALAPGAVSSNTSSLGLYSINGQRDDANYFMVDGVAANLGQTTNNQPASLSGTYPSQTALGTTQSLLSVDALEEFRIQTSGYSAEYGRQPGGQVQLQSRAGTNTWHGSAFDYLRNTIFDANSWYADHNGIPKQADHQNDFGGTIGGPVDIPHVYDGKNRTFFFFSYEGLRLLLPYSGREYDPTAALRQVSASSVRPYINSFPIPNGAPSNDGCTTDGTTTGPACDALFTAGFSVPSSLNATSVRVDQAFGQKLRLFARYANTPSVAAQRAAPLSSIYSTRLKSQTLTVGATIAITPLWSDEFRFNVGLSQKATVYSMDSFGGATPFPENGIAPTQYTGGAPGGEFDLYLGICCPGGPGYGNYQTGNQKQYQLVDSVALSLGRHSLKMGVDFRRLAPTYNNAHYATDVGITSLPDLESGTVSYLYVNSYVVAHPVFNNVSLFVQDSWKVTPRLSVDYGLRWEFNPVPGSSNGIYPLAVTQTDNLATMQLAPPGTPEYKTSYDHFAPRLGFAYSLTQSTNHPTVIRASTGLFYDTGQNLAASGYGNYPFFNYVQSSGANFPLSAKSLAPPPPYDPNAPLIPPYPITYISDPHLTLPYTEGWNVTLDQGLSAQNTFSVSYVGNAGKKLLYSEYYPSLSQVNPDFLYATIGRSEAASSYNALQIRDQGKIAEGLQLLASYSWAHARDDISTDFSSEYPPQWGNSDNDIRQVFNLALTYRIPSSNSGRLLRCLTNGWMISDRFAAQSGSPFNVIQGFYTLPLGIDAPIYPDLNPGVPIHLTGVPGVPRGWELNGAAFSEVPLNPDGSPARQGTLGRNFLHAPGFWNLNTAVERSFPLHENLNLNVRVESFNVFNHPNLTGVDSELASPTFGQLVNAGTIGVSNPLYATGGPRSLQFALKLMF
jgi:hypothetical protein